MTTWQRHAERLANEVTPRGSRWRDPVAKIPRHMFVPRWFDRTPDGWTLHDGPADEVAWSAAAYSDQTLVTSVGHVHADHAKEDGQPTGRATSSSTHPSLVIQMLRYGQIHDGADVLDVATGSGYSAALLAHRLGEERVTSVDVDPYLTSAAVERLACIGLHPRVHTIDATGPLPGRYDAIVSGVSVSPVPASWLAALKPGGRFVTTLAGTALILTANATEPGSEWAASGRIERDWAMFMPTRTGADYPPSIDPDIADAARADAGHARMGEYPVLNIGDAWELMSLLAVTVSGIVHDYEEDDDGRRVAYLMHSDGSWARAEQRGDGLPVVHQDGPRRLWNVLDGLRARWIRDGYLQLYGARAMIGHDGAIYLARGSWKAVIR